MRSAEQTPTTANGSGMRNILCAVWNLSIIMPKQTLNLSMKYGMGDGEMVDGNHIPDTNGKEITFTSVGNLISWCD